MPRKLILFVIILFAVIISAQADVIRMKNGIVYIGKILSIDAQGVELEAFGEKIKVKTNEIIKTEPDFSNLKDQNIEITLKDDSVIQGKIQNYDNDVGFLIEVKFGIVTVPLDNVRRIVDPIQGKKYSVDLVEIGVQGGYYFVVGGLSSGFGSNAAVTLFSEFNLGFLFQGLFAGVSISYYSLASASSSEYSYLLFNANASVIYKFLFFRNESSFIRNLVPFISVGAGAALPVQTYGATTTSEVDFSFTGCLGIDFYLSDNLVLRINGAWMSIAQSAVLFNAISVNAGLACTF